MLRHRNINNIKLQSAAAYASNTEDYETPTASTATAPPDNICSCSPLKGHFVQETQSQFNHLKKDLQLSETKLN